MFAALVSAALLAALPAPQKTPTKQQHEAMLAKVIFRAKALPAVSYSVKGTMAINTQGIALTANFSTAVNARKDGAFKVNSTVSFAGQTTRGTAVSNGKTVWDINLDSKEFSEKPSEPASFGGDFANWAMDRAGIDLVLLALGDTTGISVKDLLAARSITVKNYPTEMVNGRRMYRIPVTSLGKSEGLKGGRAEVLADAATMDIHRLTLNINTNDGGSPTKVVFTFNYSPLKQMKEADDALFAFVPPEGFTKSEVVNGAFARAFNQEKK